MPSKSRSRIALGSRFECEGQEGHRFNRDRAIQKLRHSNDNEVKRTAAEEVSGRSLRQKLVERLKKKKNALNSRAIMLIYYDICDVQSL